uniref:(California timema) hypothetical protein n=1 Tax=Timema californicum TaxID=61474 RepID=A0A7R9IZM5_TIMCA|nr:unnamed protein product [Timema californicum]
MTGHPSSVQASSAIGRDMNLRTHASCADGAKLTGSAWHSSVAICFKTEGSIVSRSHEFSTNRLNGEDVETSNDVPPGVIVSSSNEVTSAASAQLSSTFPTDQVPVSRDTTDCTNERGADAQVVLLTGMEEGGCYSKEGAQCPCRSSLAAVTIQDSKHSNAGLEMNRPFLLRYFVVNKYRLSEAANQEGETVVYMVPGVWRSCDCTPHPNKSEALRRLQSSGPGGRGGAGAGPPSPLPLPVPTFSSSVISSSSLLLVRRRRPSLRGASSSGNSAQNNTITGGAEPTRAVQAILNPNNNITATASHVQNQQLQQRTGAVPNVQDNNLVIISCKDDDSCDEERSIPKSLSGPATLSATVQGYTDISPPISFNNVNSNKSMCVDLSSHRAGENLTQSATVKQNINCGNYAWAPSGPASNARWGIPHGLGLRGGGESTLNVGTSSWGASAGGSVSGSNSAAASNTSSWGAGSGQGQGGAAGQTQWSSGGGGSNRNSGGGSGGGSSQGPSSQQNTGECSTLTLPRVFYIAGYIQVCHCKKLCVCLRCLGAASKSSSQSGGQPTPQQPTPSQAPPGAQQGQNGSTSWAQAAGKGLPASSQGSGPNSTTSSSSGGGNGGGSAATGVSTAAGTAGSVVTGSSVTNTSTKQQLEQLNTMREALFSQDGWGGVSPATVMFISKLSIKTRAVEVGESEAILGGVRV